MPRIRGRRLYPSTLEERRIMNRLGCDGSLYVGRGQNPFLVARRLERVARNASPDMLFLRTVAAKSNRPKFETVVSPPSETQADQSIDASSSSHAA